MTIFFVLNVNICKKKVRMVPFSQSYQNNITTIMHQNRGENMATMFKKTRRNFRKKITNESDSDHDQNDNKPDDMEIEEVENLDIKIKKPKKKKKDKEKSAAPASLLSFDDPHEESTKSFVGT